MFHKQSAREDIKEWIDSLKAKTKNDFFLLPKDPPKNPIPQIQVSPAQRWSSHTSWGICFFQSFHMVVDGLLITRG